MKAPRIFTEHILGDPMAKKARTKKSKISVVFSFRNEADVLDELIERVLAMFKIEGCAHELIFVNDNSTDRSLEILQDYAGKNRSIKIVNMSRNFGVGECVLAGMEYASGDAVIYMDTDLQDPPEVIPELLAKWRDGADLVYTRRLSRGGETAFRLAMTRLAYRIINTVSEIDMPVEAGDFRLLSRRCIDELLEMPKLSHTFVASPSGLDLSVLRFNTIAHPALPVKRISRVYSQKDPLRRLLMASHRFRCSRSI